MTDALSLADPYTVATRHWHALPDGRIQCDVCPRYCKMREGQRGLCFVRGVQDGSAADRAGLQDGDLLVAVDKRPLEGVDALYDALEAAGTDGELELTVVRGEEEREVTIHFGETAEVV